jgi:hypothetical protein
LTIDSQAIASVTSEVIERVNDPDVMLSVPAKRKNADHSDEVQKASYDSKKISV